MTSAVFKVGNGTILNSISPNVQRQKLISEQDANVKKRIKNTIKNKCEVERCEIDDGENASTFCLSSQPIEKKAHHSNLEEIRSGSPVVNGKVISLFIGDLNKNVTEKMLKETFCKFSSLVSVKICVDSCGKTLGYGYLNFLSQVEADEAVDQFNYLELYGREVRIMPSLRNSFFRKNMGTNVFFSNLPLENPKLTTRAFYDTFKTFGRVLSCKLDRRKNIGFVYFEDDNSARRAIEKFNNREYFGNIVNCGIHFDREVRSSPEFELRKLKLEGMTIIKEKLISADRTELREEELKNQAPHPNAVFVKNIPLIATKEEILNHFSSIGPVKSVFTSPVSNYNSLWAFVTYKKGQDTEEALKVFDGASFMNRTIQVSRAKKKNTRQNGAFYKHIPSSKNSLIGFESGNMVSNYRQTIYLSNLSPVCTREFLCCLCCKEKIRYKSIIINNFDQTSCTFYAVVVCSSRSDALRLFRYMDKRLFGDTMVKASWQTPKGMNLVASSAEAIKCGAHNIAKGYLPRRSLEGKELTAKNKLDDHSGKYSKASDNNKMRISTISCNSITKKTTSRVRIMEILKRQVSNCIDFMKYPTATREENLKCITEYIFDVYWRSDLERINQFLLSTDTEQEHEGVLDKQVQEAIEFLGFQR